MILDLEMSAKRHVRRLRIGEFVLVSEEAAPVVEHRFYLPGVRK